MGKTVFEVSKRYHVEGTDDMAEDRWAFLEGFNTLHEAEARAKDVSMWRHVRVVDTW